MVDIVQRALSINDLKLFHLQARPNKTVNLQNLHFTIQSGKLLRGFPVNACEGGDDQLVGHIVEIRGRVAPLGLDIGLPYRQLLRAQNHTVAEVAQDLRVGLKIKARQETLGLASTHCLLAAERLDEVAVGIRRDLGALVEEQLTGHFINDRLAEGLAHQLAELDDVLPFRRGDIERMQRPQQGHDRELLVLPDAHRDCAAIGLDIHPGPFRGDQGGEELPLQLKVQGVAEVDSCRSGEL